MQCILFAQLSMSYQFNSIVDYGLFSFSRVYTHKHGKGVFHLSIPSDKQSPWQNYDPHDVVVFFFFHLFLLVGG